VIHVAASGMPSSLPGGSDGGRLHGNACLSCDLKLALHEPLQDTAGSTRGPHRDCTSSSAGFFFFPAQGKNPWSSVHTHAFREAMWVLLATVRES